MVCCYLRFSFGGVSVVGCSLCSSGTICVRMQILHVQCEYDQSRVSMFQRALSGPFWIITVIVGGFISTVVAFFSWCSTLGV